MTPVRVLALLGGVLCAAWQQDGHVLLLTDADFETAVQSLDPLLVVFSVPWCGHCRKLEPEIAKAAASLRTHDPPLHLAQIDAAANPKATAKFAIEGFPTLYFFSKQTLREYTGPHSARAIAKWLLHKVDPPVSVVRSVEEVSAFLADNPVAAVLFDNETSEASAEFRRAAEASEDHFFAIATSSESLEKFEVNATSLVLFKPYDDRKVPFAGPVTSASVSAFVTRSRAPWVSVWNDTVITYVFEKKQPVALVLYPYFRNTYYRAVMDDIAPFVKDDIKFAYMDLETTDGYKLAEFLGIEVAAQPTAMILDWDGDSFVKFAFTAESLNKETLREFIETWRAEQLVPFYKSAKAVPGKGEVLRLTGKDFAQAVSGNETLVLFYLPWSSRSRQAESLFEAAAKAGSEFIFAKVDMSANELPEEALGDLPVLRHYAAGKALWTFTEPWSKEAVEKFAGVHAKKTDL